jgi:rhamnosyltransferase
MNKPIDSPNRENTCAVVISFHPDLEFFERIKPVSEEVTKVIVVDNGSSEEEKKTLIEVSKKIENLELVLNEKNLGIAKALNIGVSIAQNQKYAWILTLDQDSLIARDYISSMSAVYDKCVNKINVMSICPLISPYRVEAERKKTFIGGQNVYSQSGKRINTDRYYSMAKSAITSGNLVRLDVFEKVGLFNENYFIDYVDSEFNLRLSKNGYKLIQSNKTVLFHDIGNPRIHSFLMKEFTTTNHNSVRRYYFFRNCISTYKKYFLSDTWWVLTDLILSIKILLKIVLFEDNKKEKLSKSLVGLYHGIIGQMGEHIINTKS